MRGTTAIIPIIGPTSKYGGFGTASTMKIREQVRAAATDDTVESVLLYVDSPGGAVAGNRDLARDVRELNKVKPVHAYAADMMASAAYGVASQAGKIVANEGAIVGSIGTMSALVDTSGAYEKAGVKVHPITSGGVKGMGMPGTKITQEQIQHQQQLINKVSAQFVNSVAEGRGFSQAKAKELADGRLHIAADAASIGLVDAVASLESSIDNLQSETSRKETPMHYAQETGNPAGLATKMPQPALVPVEEQIPAVEPEEAPVVEEVAVEEAPAAEPAAAASIEEIEACCPGAPADFILSQLKAGGSVQDAQTGYIGVLVERIAELEGKQVEAPAPEPVVEAVEPAVEAPVEAAPVVGAQPVVPQPEEADAVFGESADDFFNKALATEEAYLRENASHLDPVNIRIKATANVYRANPGLKEARFTIEPAN
jgi:signal peptide peptidase SppA